MLFASNGKAVRFDEGEVRAMGRTATGVRGIRLAEGETVCSMIVVVADGDGDILTATEHGYGKRTPVSEYARKGRGIQGVIAIQTSERNATRFFILSTSAIPLDTPSKATVTFRVNNEVGALVKVLSSFADSGLNMTRIESRPLPDTPFQYFFSADFEGAMDAAHLSRAMAAARPYTCALRLLGVYPRAEKPV